MCFFVRRSNSSVVPELSNQGGAPSKLVGKTLQVQSSSVKEELSLGSRARSLIADLYQSIADNLSRCRSFLVLQVQRESQASTPSLVAKKALAEKVPVAPVEIVLESPSASVQLTPVEKSLAELLRSEKVKNKNIVDFVRSAKKEEFTLSPKNMRDLLSLARGIEANQAVKEVFVYATERKIVLGQELVLHCMREARAAYYRPSMKGIVVYVDTLAKDGKVVLEPQGRQILEEMQMTIKDRYKDMRERKLSFSLDGIKMERFYHDDNLIDVLERSPEVQAQNLDDLEAYYRIAVATDEGLLKEGEVAFTIPVGFRLDEMNQKDGGEGPKEVSLETGLGNIHKLIQVCTGKASCDGKFSAKDIARMRIQLKETAYLLSTIDDVEVKQKALGSLMVAAGHCSEGNTSTIGAVRIILRKALRKQDSSTELPQRIAALVRDFKGTAVCLLVDSLYSNAAHERNYYMNAVGRDVNAEEAPEEVCMDGYGERYLKGVRTRTEAKVLFEENYTKFALIENIYGELLELSKSCPILSQMRDYLVAQASMRKASSNEQEATQAREILEQLEGEEDTMFFPFDENFVPQPTRKAVEQMLFYMGYVE